MFRGACGELTSACAVTVTKFRTLRPDMMSSTSAWNSWNSFWHRAATGRSASSIVFVGTATLPAPHWRTARLASMLQSSKLAPGPLFPGLALSTWFDSSLYV